MSRVGDTSTDVPGQVFLTISEKKWFKVGSQKCLLVLPVVIWSVFSPLPLSRPLSHIGQILGCRDLLCDAIMMGYTMCYDLDWEMEGLSM